MCECDYIRDDEIDDEQREYLHEYVTPRRALDGSVVWPVGELEQCNESAQTE